MKGDAAVESRLTAERQEYTVRLFFCDYFFDELRRYGQKIDFVCDVFGSLNRCDIRVHENGFDTLFAEGFQCLRAGVVELTRLADFQGSRTKEQNFVYVIKFHNCVL